MTSFVDSAIDFDAEIKDLLSSLPTLGDYEAKLNSLWDLPLPEAQNPKSKAELEVILERHHQWLQSVRDVAAPLKGCRAVFRGADLRSFDFTGKELSCVDFSEANCEGVSFRNATLVLADFTNAATNGADFVGADLTEAQSVQAS